jgi:hypothetical protein
VHGSRIDLKALDKNLHCSGHHRLQALLRLALDDGVYIVAAANGQRVGHCFPLIAIGGEYFNVEGDEAKPLSIYGTWIEDLIFVRAIAFRA